MLKNTFIHIPGVGVKTEKRLWDSGILDWNDFTETFFDNLPQKRITHLKTCIRESRDHLETGNSKYFEELLPSNLHWRLFSEFRHSTAYLDIETTGIKMWGFEITTIALYDGESIFYYVKDQNLEDFEKDIMKYEVIVTYNGKSFDIPFIESYLNIKLTQAHIDLRYILVSLGYGGGLKSCEQQLGITRPDLEDVDGYFAIFLWDDFQRNKNQKALETLLTYNMHDTVNLEKLMVLSYNLKLKDTPFLDTHHIPIPPQPDIPFQADRKTIDRIKKRLLVDPVIYAEQVK